MKEIEFRGKTTGKFPKWVYGCYISFENLPARILCQDFIDVLNGNIQNHEVEPKSVGQYTGLKDSKYNKIYEGDILKTPRGFIGQVVFGRAEEECKHKVHGRTIIDCYTTYGWIFVRGDGYRCAIDDGLLEGEIVGNIYDNPELLSDGSKE